MFTGLTVVPVDEPVSLMTCPIEPLPPSETVSRLWNFTFGRVGRLEGAVGHDVGSAVKKQ